MQAKHYHVFAGMPGYLPNSAATYDRKADAVHDAYTRALDALNIYSNDNPKMRGSKKTGYYSVTHGSHAEEIFYVETCHDTDCELAQEENWD